MGNNYIHDKSFQLIKTNPILTSNVQIIVDSNYNIYLETFNTNKQLSNDIYKNFFINKESFYEDKISLFYNNLPVNIAFDIKNDNDKDLMYKNYKHQFDDIYYSGARKVINNKYYKEEFEYFAPLYVKKNQLPNSFIILRTDDAAIYEVFNDDYTIGKTNKENFRKEIINKWKCVELFDLTEKNNFGYWLNKNINLNERFPKSPLEFDSKKYNFTRYYGIDYFSGVYTEKNMYIDDKLWFENPPHKFEKFITEGFKNNELIYPNIFNFKYLFDDTPATPFKLNKYSLNRYIGLYTDIVKIKTVTPYIQPILKNNLKIEKNIFMLNSQNTGSTNPFIENFDITKNYYVYAKDNLYKVEKIFINHNYYYKIISDYDINISDISRLNEIDIIFKNTDTNYKNIINPRLNSNFNIDLKINEEGSVDLYSDIYLIKINDKYHIIDVIENELFEKEYIIRTDYGIECDYKILKYWINGIDNKTEIMVEDTINNEKPIIFDIYKIKFYDVKDFDNNIVDTHFSDFDLNITNEYAETPEQKLYVTELRDSSEQDVFKYYDTGDNKGKIIISSSEYISSNELFEINKQGLSDIWSKNQSTVKWGFSNSNSNVDYPYKLNNSLKTGMKYNRTVNPFLKSPNILNKTNAYFYRLGEFKSGTTIQYYDTQTLSIELLPYKTNIFNLDLYLNPTINYFDYFFKNYKITNTGKELTTKYSIIDNGDIYNASETLFKGIKYSFYKVKDIIRDDNNKILNIIKEPDKTLNNLKFSIITNIQYDDNNLNKIVTTYPNINLNESGINIFYNEKYKNILILINYYLGGNTNINDINYKNPIESIYFKELTAYNFINSINNLNNKGLFNNYINFYYITDYDEIGYTKINTGVTGNMSALTEWQKDIPPIIIEADVPTEIKLKKKSFITSAVKGSKYNIYDKFKTDYTDLIYESEFIKEPLATIIKMNETQYAKDTIEHGETIKNSKTIYRFNGTYEPIFKDIELYKPYDYFISENGYFYQTKCGGHYNENSLFTDYNNLTQNNINELINLTNKYINHYEQLIIFVNTKLEDINIDIFKYTNEIYDSEILNKLNNDKNYYTNLLIEYNLQLDYWNNKKEEINNIIPVNTITANNEWVFKDKILGLCDNNNTTCEVLLNLPVANTSALTNILLIDSFNFNLPVNSKIEGITVKIKKYATNTIYTKAYDYNISLILPDGTESENKADLITEINSTSTEYAYGDDTDIWNLSNIKYYDINDDLFSLKIQMKAEKTISNPIINNINIDCVCIKIKYSVNDINTGKTYISVFERNEKFDTDLDKFGITEELIYSKINHEENILKLKNVEEDLSIYPKIDEYGYSYSDRFIFKSSWDSDYYIKTNKDIL